MRVTGFFQRGILWMVVVVGALLAGCTVEPQLPPLPCSSDADCPRGTECVAFACRPLLPDLAVDLTGPPDLTSWDEGNPPPDFTFGGVDDLDDQCPFGTRFCDSNVFVARCIPIAWCCSDADCAPTQRCSQNGQCVGGLCPPGFKACNGTCIAMANCCTNDDCASKVCLQDGTCKVPSCDDGAINGNETDTDCGGGFCGACSLGRACSIDGDCRSNVCQMRACAGPGFRVRRYGGGTGPSRVVAADLDGDGALDLASTDATSDTVSVALGRGDGRFLPLGSLGGSFAVGQDPSDLVAADLDGDHRLDLVIANRGSYDVSVLLGYGDGSFAPERRYPVGAGPERLLVADLSGDGRLDVATVDARSSTITALTGRGDGTFGERLAWETSPRPGAIAAGDLDRDGKLDLVVAAPSKLNVFLGASNAGLILLQPRLDTLTALGDAGLALALGDLDRDGKLDVVVGAQAQGGQVFLGGGNGNLILAGAVGGGGDFRSIALADLDGDKILDAATPAGVLLGAGNGMLKAPIAWPRALAGFDALALGDLDGDGRLDLAFPQGFADRLVAALGNGDGTVRALDPADPGSFVGNNRRNGSATDVRLLDPRYLLLADLDGDGRDDLLAGSSDFGQLWVQLAAPDGTLGAPALYPTPAQPGGLVAADLDEDGHLDVVVACAGGETTVLRGSRSGQLTPIVPGLNQPPPVQAPFAHTLAAGDLDRDGHLDLVLSDGMAARALRGRGDGTFDNDHPIGIAGGQGANRLQLVDLDGDGALDVLLGNGFEARYALSQGVDGKGQLRGFAAAVAIAGPQGPVSDAWAADLDGDGAIDVALVDRAQPQVQVCWAGKPSPGKVALGAPLGWAVGGVPLGLALLDADGDGRLDLAAALPDGGQVAVLLADGQQARSFLPPVRYEVGPNPVWLAVGDANHDGKADLAVTSPGLGATVALLLNTR